MTYENLYEEQLNKVITQYRTTYSQPLSMYAVPEPIPTDIVPLLQMEKKLAKNIAVLKGVVLPPLTFDAKASIVGYYTTLEQAESEKRESLIANAEAEKTKLQETYENDVARANQYNASLSEPYKEKHAMLLQYKDKLKRVFDHYDITPLDMSISDNLTVAEFQTLIDESIRVCEKYANEQNSNLFDRVMKPLKGEKNIQFTLSYSLIVLVVAYLALPLIAPLAFVKMCMSTHNLYKDIEALRIANALMTQIDYNRFVDESAFESVTPPDLGKIDEELKTDLDGIKDYSKDKEAATKVADEVNIKIQKQLVEVQTEVKGEIAKLATTLTNKHAAVQEAIDKYMSNYHEFPTVQNNSVVMDHKFALGKIEGRIDVREEVPLKNMVFDDTNRENAINAIKLYLANALLSVRVKQLVVEIFDPKNMCSEFTEFLKPETTEYIKPNKMDLNKLMTTYRDKLQQNIIDMDNMTIDAYNKQAEERESMPKAYQLLIILSNFKELKEGNGADKFMELMRFSAQSGVLIWLLDHETYPDTLRVDDNVSLRANAIQYTRDLGKRAIETYVTALAKYKDTGIDYVAKLGDVFIPREKWWTWDTIKGVYMPWGVNATDPSQGMQIWPMLGDANVHALLGGATGAGKSAEINQHLISLITMYPPSELILVYIDFKNVEAAKFTRGFDKTLDEWMTADYEKTLRENGEYYSRLSRIPHLKIISGTTDGEYALSVFEFLMQEMARRQQIINKFGVTKVQEMREQILAQYNTDHNGDPKKGTWADMRKDWDWYKPNVYDKYGDLPRLVVIFDEFQVMFNTEFVEQKVIDTINGKITAITKLARAMACHFWFTSQSMKGTMSKDTIGNFSLRGALRCASDVSDELLGNNAAGTITAKFGYMYTNDSAGQDKAANRFWRVPFLDEKKMPAYIDTLNEMLEPFNEKHLMAEFYDEKILVPSGELDKWYDTYPESFADINTFILGERAGYSTNKAPVSVNLMDDGGENLMIAAFERNDMMNLGLTIIDNLKKKDVTLIINCQDKDTYQLMAIDELVDERFAELSTPRQDVPELVDALEAMVQGRMEKEPPYEPVYIVLIQWERAPNISTSPVYRLQERFKDILRDAPTVGIHFVFICKEKLEMPRSIPAACNHKIGGLLTKDAMFFIETSKVEKLPDVNKDQGLFAIYEYGPNTTKFRIYQHTFKRQLKSREVVIK